MLRRGLNSTKHFMAGSLTDRKSQYRKHFKTLLGNLTIAETEQQSHEVTSKVLKTEQYKNARAISIFLSMPTGEISTRQIILQAFKDGKDVFVPYIQSAKEPKSKVMHMLRLQDEEDLNAMQPDAWGIPSLSKESIPSRENVFGGTGCSNLASDLDCASLGLDLILMPAMAFDQSHNRLGHGRGFYDRFLTRLRQRQLSSSQSSGFPHLVGLALREQVLPEGEELPTTELDWKVDSLIVADL